LFAFLDAEPAVDSGAPEFGAARVAGAGHAGFAHQRTHGVHVPIALRRRVVERKVERDLVTLVDGLSEADPLVDAEAEGEVWPLADAHDEGDADGDADEDGDRKSVV
jgi:hypothetical protein